MRRRLIALVTLAIVAGGGPRSHADDSRLDLAQVAGADEFPGGTRAREVLASEGFVVLPRYHKQIFSPYIGGPLPHYVTCDSAHYTYQVLFEGGLTDVERALAQRVSESIDRLHAGLASSTPTSPRLGAGHALALGYVEVARRLLGGEAGARAAPGDAVDAEVRRIEAATGPAESPLFHVAEDYAEYLPRGRYVGDPAQERYFRAVKWLGRMGFRVVDERETTAALLLVRAAQRDAEARSRIEAVDRLLGTLVGPPDDLTLAEYSTTMRATIPGEWTDAALEAGLADTQRALAKARAPEINASLLPPAEWRAFRERTKGLRLLPARRTPDAWLFQALNESESSESHRSGLEVAAALGAGAAARVLAAAGGELGRRSAEQARGRADDLRKRAAGTHYGASLDALSQMWDERTPLLGDGAAPGGDPGTPILPAPLFRSNAWRDRLLTTGLAAWTSLRHAWVLHAKESTVCLGDVIDTPGVVEPAARFYGALAALARSFASAAEGVGASRADARGILSEMLPALRRLAAGDAGEEELARLVAQHGDALERLPAERSRGGPRAAVRRLLPRLEAWLAGSGTLDAKETAWVESLGKPETFALLDDYASLMDDLREIAEQELAGKELTAGQAGLVAEYGKRIARLNGFHGDSWLAPHEQMGYVVDVASDPRRASRLLEAVGPAMEIYVALPLRGGGHQLYVGGVYSHFEFESGTPLTDGEWRTRIEARRLPPQPPWTASYVVAPDVDVVVARIDKGERPDEADGLHDERIGRALIARLARTEAKDGDGEERAEWLAQHAAAYADGPLHEDVVQALLRMLLAADLEPEYVERDIVIEHDGRSTRHLNAAAYHLARIAGSAERTQLISAVLSPPAGSSENARGWVAIALAQLSPPVTPAEAKPMLDAGDPEVRRSGVDALLQRLARDREAPAGPAVECLVGRLFGERDERVIRTVLRGLTEIAPRIPREHVGRFAVFLDSKEPRTRAVAADLVGALHDTGSADRLLALNEDEDLVVAGAAVRALGRALTGATDEKARRAIAAFEANVVAPSSPSRGAWWDLQQGSLEGMGSLGGELGATALERVATNPKVDDRLRRNAVRQLAEVGKPAIPSLYRLAFDESESGDRVNAHATRLCDVAVEALDRLLGGRLGWGYGWPGEERARGILEKVRKEARENAYAK